MIFKAIFILSFIFSELSATLCLFRLKIALLSPPLADVRSPRSGKHVNRCKRAADDAQSASLLAHHLLNIRMFSPDWASAFFLNMYS
jgi:hypothetical protein